MNKNLNSVLKYCISDLCFILTYSYNGLHFYLRHLSEELGCYLPEPICPVFFGTNLFKRSYWATQIAGGPVKSIFLVKKNHIFGYLCKFRLTVRNYVSTKFVILCLEVKLV